MKKILLLGGSAQQIAAIETAKRLGYYTVLCDYLTDNPGQYHADKFYLASTTDKDAVLEVAQKEKVDGVLAYASDPAAPTAAYVAEKLGLPTNPYKSVEILSNKDMFREFLRENGFNTPFAKGYTSLAEAESDIKNGLFKLPVIIKPVDSSGSKGVTVLRSLDNAVRKNIEFAFSFSRSSRVIIEKYIEKATPYLIGGDIFVLDGKVVLWGLMNCHRDSNVNPLVPVGKSYPPDLNKKDLSSVMNDLQKLVNKAGITDGEMNIEAVVDNDGKVWIIDIGARSGGNMIPELLGMIFSTDLVELSVRAAMGELRDTSFSVENPFYATANIHASRDGIFERIDFDPCIERFIVKKCIYKEKGDKVERFDNASRALGIVFMKFNSSEEMLDMMDNSDKWIKVILK